jgi:hypothetical protein
MDMTPPSGLTGNYSPPKSKTEKIIAQIWKETLDLEKVGIDENF